MSPPAWTRNKTKYKKYVNPNGSVNVIHFSPGKKKVTIRVPKNSASNVPAFLRKHFAFKLPPGITVRRLSSGRVVIERTQGTSTKTIPMPNKNPTNKNIEHFIKKEFGPRMPKLNTHFGPITGYQVEANNFWQNATNNGRTGTALTSLNKTGKLRTLYNVTKGRKYVRPGIAKLGKGEQAVVYLGYYDKAATRPVSIKAFPLDLEFPMNKQPAQTEFDIGRKVHEVVPTHAPRYISIERTIGFAPASNFARLTGPTNARYQIVILSEYFHGGDLNSWIKKVTPRLDESTLIDIVRQVLSSLVKIQEKYPGFRHNDLHVGNVFIDDTGNRPRAAIADFGLARLSPTMSNPIINKGLFIGNGIGPLTSSRYDAHMFLNSIWTHIPVSRYPRLKHFIETVLPAGYKGVNDTYIKNKRLKYGIEYPGLPSTHEMLKQLTEKPNKVYPKGTFKLTASNLQRARQMLKPVNRKVVCKPCSIPSGTEAANIAAKALQGVKGVTVSATNFLKLSPKSKAALMKTGAKKKPVTLQFKKLAHDPTASKKTNVGAYAKILLEKKKASSPSYNLNKLFKTPPRPIKSAKNILNSATQNKNVNALTVRQLRTVLERYSYSKANAKREARAWANAWANRVGKRRQNLKLTKNANGRIRAGRKLLNGHKKDELVAMARKHGLTTNGKTKEQLIRLLWQK